MKASKFLWAASLSLFLFVLLLVSAPARLLNLAVGHPLAVLISEAFGGHPCFPNFIECQIHDQMTMADADDVMDLS